jgi:putative tryptophan/tyrosine transport system substrate-binding protein
VRRRELSALLCGALISPMIASAQQSRQARRVAVLVTTGENDPEWNSERDAFLEAMRGFGWAEGQNLHIEYRFGAGDPNRLAAFAKELVGLQPDVLLARSTTSVHALVAETRMTMDISKAGTSFLSSGWRGKITMHCRA